MDWLNSVANDRNVNERSMEHEKKKKREMLRKVGKSSHRTVKITVCARTDV